jgi:integrase/recombinase XerD
MLVQRVVMAASGVESWTVLGADDAPVEPVERYLAYLTGIERSPNTVKAYAHDLKDYWVFLAHRDLDWREVRLEDVGEFVAWLRLPPAGRSGQVAVLPAVEPQVGASTINRKLSAVGAFYQYQARNGVDVGELLATWQLPGRRGGGNRFCTTSARAGPSPGERSRCERPPSFRGC